MKNLARVRIAAAVFLAVVCSYGAKGAEDKGGTEYARHLGALSQMSVAVAEAMLAEKYGFKPHPESMTFGELMVHIASTNYQFCAGLKDTSAPPTESPTAKDAIVRMLSDSFEY